MKTNRWRSRRGQSLVEMAMVLPVLAILTFGLVDFGRAYYFQVSVTNAAREGARVAILNVYTGPQSPSCSTSNNYQTCPVQFDTAPSWAPSAPSVVSAVNKELVYSGIPPKSITVCPPHDSSISTAGCPDASNRVDKWTSGDPESQNYYVTVTVTYDFHLYTPLMQGLVGDPIHMSVSVQMRTNY